MTPLKMADGNLNKKNEINSPNNFWNDDDTHQNESFLNKKNYIKNLK